jgi:hypothetical protein
MIFGTLSAIVHDVGSAAIFPESEIPEYSSGIPTDPETAKWIGSGRGSGAM